LPPYLNGRPHPIEGALPLGIIDLAEFSVMHFQLAKSDRLMMVSDGIAEATDANSHLFGFERVVELLRSPISAADLAHAATKLRPERRYQCDFHPTTADDRRCACINVVDRLRSLQAQSCAGSTTLLFRGRE
jgi:hypothetical protein